LQIISAKSLDWIQARVLFSITCFAEQLMKKNISVAVPTDTYCRPRIWVAKRRISVSRIVATTLRKMAELTDTYAPYRFLQNGCETVSASQINSLQAQFHSHGCARARRHLLLGSSQRDARLRMAMIHGKQPLGSERSLPGSAASDAWLALIRCS
jgi:hypothetical protein